MTIKVGINGFGRIGRVVFRKCFENSEIELSAINDPAVDVEYICYLIKFDSSHGKFKGHVTYKDNEIIINGKKIQVFRERLPPKIPWHTAGVDYVVEASGMFTCLEKAAGHLNSEQVRRVIVTAPTMDIPMIILGVNDDQLKRDHKVLSCGSSTLYCLAPIIKVLNDSFGVSEGFITSIHAMTPSLKPLDGLCLRGKHWRDHRSILQNIIPASTGACKALSKIMPEVKDNLTGLAFRVPVVGVSVLDITVRLNTNTTIADIVKCVGKASNTNLKNIIKTSNENAVSSDFIGDSHSCILDVDSSMALKPNFFKLICWYENEYSYACRVLDSIYFSEKQISESMKISKTCASLKSTHSLTEASKDSNYAKGESKLTCTCLGKPSRKARSLNIRHSSPKSLVDSNKYEVVKVWNDDCDKSKSSIRKKCGSFFHCCAAEKTNPAKETECLKKKECLEEVKKDFSNMLTFTEELLKKSYNKKIVSLLTQKCLSKLIKENSYEQFQTKSQDDSFNKLKDKALTNMCTLKKCCNIENNINKKSLTNIINTEKTKSNVYVERCNSCETANKTFKTENITIDENIERTLYNESNMKNFRSDPILEMINKTNNGESIVQKGFTKAYIDFKQHKDDLKDKIKMQDVERDFTKSNKASNVNLNNITEKENLEPQFCVKSGLDKFVETDLSSGKINFDTQRHQCKPNTIKDKEEKYILKDSEYLINKNHNMNIIDEELKKCKATLLNLNANWKTPVIENNSSPVEIEDFHQVSKSSNILADLNSFSSEMKDLSQHDGYRNLLSFSNGDKRKQKQDIYDKLDSASATDSNDSFYISDRKSQVINITDLTSSLEDLARMDKICRIIEISDELSNELFSALDNDNPMVENKKWSFKDLCERIHLDSFCNKVFGPTGI